MEEVDYWLGNQGVGAPIVSSWLPWIENWVLIGVSKITDMFEALHLFCPENCNEGPNRLTTPSFALESEK